MQIYIHALNSDKRYIYVVVTMVKQVLQSLALDETYINN